MNTGRLFVRSITYYWRTNLAVLLGVMAGTAVISGALVVGDSVRNSLRTITLDSLGDIDHVLHGHRFFREELADALSNHPDFRKHFTTVAPAIVMEGALERSIEKNGTANDVVIHRVGKVNLYALDKRLWNLTDHGDVPVPVDNNGNPEIVLSKRVATELSGNSANEENISDLHKRLVGQTVTLSIELPATIPRDSLLGKRDETTVEIELTVKAVLEETSGVGRLNLKPNQQLPSTAFVALDTLQKNLGLAEVKSPPQRKRVAAPARVNALFVKANSDAGGSGKRAREAARSLTALVSEKLSPADLNLRIVENKQYGYLSLESDQQILQESLAAAGRQAADELRLAMSPVFVYLANDIANPKIVVYGKKGEPQIGYSKYSIIAGLDMANLDKKPFGPFSYIGQPPATPLQPDQIILNSWLKKDLESDTHKLKIGDEISVTYHLVGSHGELPEVEKRFRLAGFVDFEKDDAHNPANDRGLAPVVPGITDAETFGDWDEPFPMKLDQITDSDEAYWSLHRATPKAFISLAVAQQMWRSRYGQLTSLRVATLPGKPLPESAEAFTRTLMKTLEPDQTGLVFQPVKFDGLEASSGTTPFSELFIGFSFFLILSASILIGLLFRLGIDRRTGSVGLLSAVGFAPKQVRRLFLGEGLIVVIAGGLLGVGTAVGYASLMIYGLKTWWFGAVGTRFLDVHLKWTSLAAGFGISLAVTLAVVWWALRQLRTLSARELLSGATQPPVSAGAQQQRGKKARKMAIAGAASAALLLVVVESGFVPEGEAFPGVSISVVTFFLVGMALLAASLSFLSAWLDSDHRAAVAGGGFWGMGRLGMSNAARHRQRSVLTVALIASATFVIVAVAAGHRNPVAEAPDKESGNGGFTLLAETSTPLLDDLNSDKGRDNLDLVFDPKSTDPKVRRKAELIANMRAMPFRVQPGEDASCLNIYQTRLPTVLGATPAMIDRGGFKFSGAKVDNPWTLLNQQHEPATHEQSGKTLPVYPVLGDLNTLQYSLKKGIGQTIAVPDDQNPEGLLKIVGIFDGSVFQGVLILSEENFRTLYPERSGYEYFLIEVDPAQSKEQTKELAVLLETTLNHVGFDAEPVAKRLADFLAVQNTYLSTFQTLGGLGLLLGTLGLATVMLRNVLERRSELALLRAVGFRSAALRWLVLWENAFLLAWGLTSGTVSALLAMTPHLRKTGADVPWQDVGLMLVGVFAIGTAAALLAVIEAVRTPIVQTLRSE